MQIQKKKDYIDAVLDELIIQVGGDLYGSRLSLKRNFGNYN